MYSNTRYLIWILLCSKLLVSWSSAFHSVQATLLANPCWAVAKETVQFTCAVVAEDAKVRLLNIRAAKLWRAGNIVCTEVTCGAEAHVSSGPRANMVWSLPADPSWSDWQPQEFYCDISIMYRYPNPWYMKDDRGTLGAISQPVTLQFNQSRPQPSRPSQSQTQSQSQSAVSVSRPASTSTSTSPSTGQTVPKEQLVYGVPAYLYIVIAFLVVFLIAASVAFSFKYKVFLEYLKKRNAQDGNRRVYVELRGSEMVRHV